MDSVTDGLTMDALSAAVYLPWYRGDSFLSPNTEEVFYLMVSQSAPSGIFCSEAGCIDVCICLLKPCPLGLFYCSWFRFCPHSWRWWPFYKCYITTPDTVCLEWTLLIWSNRNKALSNEGLQRCIIYNFLCGKSRGCCGVKSLAGNNIDSC